MLGMYGKRDIKETQLLNGLIEEECYEGHNISHICMCIMVLFIA